MCLAVAGHREKKRKNLSIIIYLNGMQKHERKVKKKKKKRKQGVVIDVETSKKRESRCVYLTRLTGNHCYSVKGV